jgi:hypothetical protein
MPHKIPPRIFRTPDNIEWTFLETFPDYERLQKFRLNNHSYATNSDGKKSRIRFYCYPKPRRVHNCKFKLLALKTSKEGYHVYKHGEHNHATIKPIEDEDAEEEEIEEEDGDEEEANQEESIEEQEEENPENEPIEHERGNMGGGSMEVDGIEFPLEKCQCRLNSALQNGQMERAKKWMGRIPATEIGQVITEMDKENMTKLVGMANSDIGISKKRYKLTS